MNYKELDKQVRIIYNEARKNNELGLRRMKISGWRMKRNWLKEEQIHVSCIGCKIMDEVYATFNGIVVNVSPQASNGFLDFKHINEISSKSILKEVNEFCEKNGEEFIYSLGKKLNVDIQKKNDTVRNDKKTIGR